jgi:hypothetical protein
MTVQGLGKNSESVDLKEMSDEEKSRQESEFKQMTIAMDQILGQRSLTNGLRCEGIFIQ